MKSITLQDAGNGQALAPLIYRSSLSCYGARQPRPEDLRRRRKSHSGRARQAHDQAAAERRLEQAMQLLGMEDKPLLKLPKGSPEKLVLARWLRENTTLTLRWVSERLGMGHYTRVTQTIRRMSCRPGGKLERMKRQLASVETAPQPNACE